ncbi:MAG: hypothetical protein ABSA70_02575 [Terriglobia bacterium]
MKESGYGGIARCISSFILYTSPFLLAFLLPSVARADEFSQLSRYSAQMFPRGTVVVDTRVGDLTIEGWDQARVEIEAEKVVRATSEAKAKRLYEQIKIELKENDEEVRLRVIFPPRRPWRLFRGATKLSVNFRIRMPVEASLAVRCVDGDLRIRGIAGRQEVRVNYGNVEITVPSLWRLRSLNARTWLGYAESNLHDEGSAGFGRKISFWNPQGEQDITVQVHFGGVYVYRNE